MKSKKNWKVVVLMTAVLLSLTSAQVFATVTPSVSQNPAPKVVGAVTYTGADGNVITIAASDVKIVADGAASTLTPEQQAVYEKAKAEFTNANSQANKDLAEFLTKNYPDIPAENVVVREIFDINVGQTLAFDNGQKLELTLSGTYKPGDTVVVTVYNKDTGKWDFIESNDVTINADGTLTVKFPHLCPVAILVADSGTATATTVGGGSNTSSMLLPILGVTAVALVVILAIVFVVLKKKKSV